MKILHTTDLDMWDRNARHGIKLYVRRVFIMDDAEQLMPLYMRFVRGGGGGHFLEKPTQEIAGYSSMTYFGCAWPLNTPLFWLPSPRSRPNRGRGRRCRDSNRPLLYPLGEVFKSR